MAKENIWRQESSTRMGEAYKSGNLRAIQTTYNRASDESKAVAIVGAFRMVKEMLWGQEKDGKQQYQKILGKEELETEKEKGVRLKRKRPENGQISVSKFFFWLQTTIKHFHSGRFSKKVTILFG